MTTIKRFLTLFTILTTLSLTYAWGQTSITLSSGSASGGVITWSASGVCTITQAASGTSGETAPNSSYISAPRWYKWNIITFTAASGKKFDELTIVCTSAAYATALAGSTYTTTAGTGSVSASASSTTVTISITGTVTAFTINMGGQSRLSSITVTSSTSGSTPVATPTFSPAEGTYSSTQSVTISCATTGATIYYTTDGSTPTTSSTEYSSAISVSTTTTIKAIATKSGMTNSAVASATYTITSGGGGGCSGSSATYTVTSTSAVSQTGTAPTGAGSSYTQTYATAKQATGGNSFTLTLTGYEGKIIKGITLSMHSNKSSGSGSLTAVVGGTTTIASISTAAFNTSSWNGAWSQDYVDVPITLSNDSYEIADDENVVITISASANSLFCESYTICWEDGSGAGISSPKLDTDAGVVCANGGSKAVKVQSYNSSYTYYYTTNGTDPTTSSSVYSDATGIVITGTPAGNAVTIKIIATDDVNTSSVRSVEYTVYNVPNTAATAYTPAEAIALYDLGLTCLSGTSVYVKGYVSSIVEAYSSTYHNISYNVSSDGTTSGAQFEFWRNKDIGCANWNSADDLEVGDYVVGYGELKKYSSTYEFDEGNCLVEHIGATPCSDPSTPLTITCASTVMIDETLSLTTTGGHSGAITWDISYGTGAATISGTTLTPASLGTVTVTATQGKSDDKLTCGSSDFKTITITAHPATVILSEAGAETTVDGLYVGDSYTLPTTSASTCGGKTLVGWSTTTVAETDTKPTTNFYDKGSAITLAASQKFYAVYAELGTAKEFAFDITTSDFNTTSYAANNNEKTTTANATDASGNTFEVKWTSHQVYKNSGTMQWKGGEGYIYNSTDLGKVNSVTITENSGNSGTFSTYYGTAEQPSSGAAGDGKGYFKTKVGSGVGKTDNIHVVFTAASLSKFSTTCCTDVNAPQVSVELHASKVGLSWELVSGATGYNVSVSLPGALSPFVNVDLAANVNSYTVTGLTMTTDYEYTVTAKGASCNSGASGIFTTTGPEIDIVEWQEEDVVLYIDAGNLDPLVIIDGEVEHGSLSGLVATDLFFAKYFEGSGSMKLISVFNGTAEKINLASYKIVDKHNGDNGSSIHEYPLGSLGYILPGQEIIFFTRPKNTNAEKKLYECSNDFLDGVASKNGEKDNPRWIECGDGQTLSSLIFNGDDAMLLQKDGANIDVIGATSGIGATTNNCRNEASWSGTVANMDKGKTASDFSNITLTGSETYLDYGVDMTSDNISIHTARCILFRNKDVTSGERAVALNTSDFVTLSAHSYLGEPYPSEWSGRSVCTTTARCEELGWTYTAGGSTYKDNSAATCNSYQDLGNFNYNSYYTDYDNISNDKHLSDYTSNDRNEYTIHIDDLSDYSCLNLRFQLKDGDEVITEQPVQVPIIVAADAETDDALFNEIVKDGGTPLPELSIKRCKTCNVVVLDGATLTKAADDATNDVAQVRDLKIYPGGKLEVPSTTHYTVNSLSFRRQEDDICMADLQGTLNVQKENGVYLDLRIDPSNWHYVSLPYDCNVSDIKFSNGEDATLGKDYLIAWYDGAARARDKTGGWTDVTAGTTLKKGLGYIVSLPGTSKIRKEIRFPMANGVIVDEKADKTVGSVYAYGGDKTDAQLTPNHKGWNLIGNPYLMYYATDLTTPLAVGHLDEDGSTYKRSGDLRYLVAPINNGWSGYSQVAISTHMPPFTAYFVQIGANNKTGEDDPEDAKTVTFHQSAAGKTSIVRRRIPAEEVEDTHPVWFGVKMTAPNAEKDNTTLLISNDFTDDYDMMDDLVKMRGDYYQYFDLPVLASLNNAGEMAFNALPDVSAEAGVPLVYFASQAGTYTFAVDEQFMSDEVKSARLFDANTNEDHDLLADTYSFQTNRGENTNRFTLFVSVERKKAPQIATDIDNLYDDVAPRKVLINGHVYIVRGRAVYDLTGKQVLNR